MARKKTIPKPSMNGNTKQSIGISGGNQKPPLEPAAPVDVLEVETPVVKPSEKIDDTFDEGAIEAQEGALRVFSVDLRDCLIGQQLVAATSPSQAYEIYKKQGGVVKSRYQPEIRETNLDPHDAELRRDLFGGVEDLEG